MDTKLLSPVFLNFSTLIGKNPLYVQGAGGNTSIKNASIMWIKASGTELADAERRNIFVAVDKHAAKAEAQGKGDGSCITTTLDFNTTLRPSIETTFHAALNWSVIAHTHSVASLVHTICPEGRLKIQKKLVGLPYVIVPYAKPGLPLTREILARVTLKTKVIILENHGLVCCGNTVEDVAKTMNDVEKHLQMPVCAKVNLQSKGIAPAGYSWAEESWIARDQRACHLAMAGSYYPDHVVFLGPALSDVIGKDRHPAYILPSQGILVKTDITPTQQSMLKCLSNVLSRLPKNWTPEPIGIKAEEELLNWDAEKYRQALSLAT